MPIYMDFLFQCDSISYYLPNMDLSVLVVNSFLFFFNPKCCHNFAYPFAETPALILESCQN